MEQQIQERLQKLEDLIDRGARHASELRADLEAWANDNKISIYARAPGMSYVEQLVGALGTSRGLLSSLHAECQKFDPRPQPRTGDGK